MLRRAVFAAALAALPLAAAAQTETPEAFLRAIYEPYKTPGYKGQPYWEPERFFNGDLAQAIERDMRAADKRKEPPTLDGDPFVDAQDWQVTAVNYSVAPPMGNKAVASVSFVNSGQPTTLSINLVQTSHGWRIADIVSPHGSLRALFKLK